MKRAIWSPGALEDIKRLRKFIQPKNPDAARRAVKAIRAGVKTLETNPKIGRPADDLSYEYREWLIRFGGSMYVARYRIEDGQVVVLAIRHGLEADY